MNRQRDLVSPVISCRLDNGGLARARGPHAAARVELGMIAFTANDPMSYHPVMRTILATLTGLAILTGFLFAGPLAAQPAQNPLTFVQAGQWAQAQMAAARGGDPLAEKLIVYYRMLAPNAASVAEIAAFMRQNPDWPLPTLMERRRQDAIAADPDNATVVALCVEKKPTPTPARGAALLRCADALANIGRGKEAAALAREAWVDAISDPGTEVAFARRFPGLISAADQWARFQRLLWDDTAAAQRQVANLDPGRAAIASARLVLKTNGTGTIGRADDDPGAVLDMARALRKLDQDQAALAVWRTSGTAAQRAAPDHLDAYWGERHTLARKLLRQGDAKGAFDIMAAHGQTDPKLVVEGEFLAGFIALRRLNDPKAAAAHFSALAAASPAVLTQSRAHYWLGRAAQAAGGNGRPEFERAAGFPMTFYGQLALRAAGEPDTTLVGRLRVPVTPAAALPATPIMSELMRAASLLVAWQDPRRARPFLLRMEELCKTPAERIAVGEYAASLGLPDVIVLITRRLGRDGDVPPMQGWPVPVEPPALLEPAISLAIMRQESNFDVSIVSPSGALGLMQLMPATARTVARQVGESTSTFLLTTDPGHNMRLGTSYLREVLDKFESVPLAAAAYNAGPHRVTQWLSDNGDPRASGQSMIDWIEMIPLNETRNYVQRVLENVVVYQARRTGTLPAMMGQWSQ
jgi:soluble lytic murein transglycosylase